MIQPIFEESEIIDMNLNSEIRYLEFNNVFEYKNAYKVISMDGEDDNIIIHFGRHRFKEKAWIIVFYWNEDLAENLKNI